MGYYSDMHGTITLPTREAYEEIHEKCENLIDDRTVAPM